jgi:hypothetical protein
MIGTSAASSYASSSGVPVAWRREGKWVELVRDEQLAELRSANAGFAMQAGQLARDRDAARADNIKWEVVSKSNLSRIGDVEARA